MTIRCLQMTLAGSGPESVRVVNLAEDTPLELASLVVRALFGLSGGEPERWETGEVAHAATTIGEALDGAAGEVRFEYGRDASWLVTVGAVGEVEEDLMVPLLIEATGPDALESCGGAATMAKLRDSARRMVAGVATDPASLLALHHHLPHLTPPMMVQRLTTVDQVAVAERLANRVPPAFVDAGEELSFDDADDWLRDTTPNEIADFLEMLRTGHAMGPDGGGSFPLPEEQPPEVGVPVDSRWVAGLPELRQTDAERLTEAVRWLLDFIGEGRPLTQAGYLKPADVGEIAEYLRLSEYWPGSAKREIDTLPVLVLRRALTHFGFLEVRGGRIAVTWLAEELRDRPMEMVRRMAEELPLAFSSTDLEMMLAEFQDWAGGRQKTTPFYVMAESYPDNLHLFQVISALERNADFFAPEKLTEAGQALVGEIFRGMGPAEESPPEGT